ncbi:hypothetical protein [Verrucosispora sp. TAA-831]|uniref:hypothetical protein n=1 Tax=Verrucosispora sp. TAA-831 TaxID=3422227 RepID=UPI003D6F1498
MLGTGTAWSEARVLAGAGTSAKGFTDAESLRLVREYKQQQKAAAKAKATGG